MWKYSAAILLVFSIWQGFSLMQHRYRLAQAEMDAYRSDLGTARETTRQMADELANSYRQADHYRQQIAIITAAHARASRQLIEIEERHANALRTLETLHRQDTELAAWSAAELPATAVDWLRDTLTGPPSHHSNSGDPALPVAIRVDTTNSTASPPPTQSE